MSSQKRLPIQKMKCVNYVKVYKSYVTFIRNERTNFEN